MKVEDMADSTEVMVAVNASGVDLGKILGILAEINKDLGFVRQAISVADSNPAIWQLPGLSKLQPYEKAAVSVIDFLLQLDQRLLTVLGQ
jgi:hypothetical protein